MTDSRDTQAPQRVLSNLRVIAFLFKQWRRRPYFFAALVGFTAIATAFDVMVPIAAGALIDALNSENGSHWGAYALFIGLAASVNLFRQIAVRFEVRFSSANMAEMVTEAFAKVQRFSLDWHANTFAGSVVRKVTRGMWAYDTITATTWFGLIPSIAVMTGLGLYMLARWPVVGLFALTVTVIFIALTIWAATSYIRPQNIRSNALDSELGGAVADAVGGIATVKSFGAEPREDDRFSHLAWRWRAEVKKTWLRFVNTWLIQIVAILALQAGLTGLLISLWAADQASPGDVVFAITAFLMMAGYMRRFGEEVQNVQRGLDEIQDIAGFDRMGVQIADTKGAPDFKPGTGEIVFDRVGFAYENAAKPIYSDFDLTIAPGEKVALVGPTGSGKSTFVKLVQRLYDVQDGAVRIDGQDVRTVRQDSLRRAIALVPQDPALFHRSIAENIAYGRPGASLADIREAARLAHADGFISALPDGYDTLVGERGVKLSGGERQRVAIARAILADAPILIFDEATSSLDNETERDVQTAMEAATAGKTTLVIAHRLSTIRDADRILVFEDGRIVEQGRHDDLIAEDGGLYARLSAVAAG
ncbi:ABC transporter ATP-binding protein [Hyphobacterium marinum]|uniref:ABC transporter ATP-binding protein n=1 Tax=Hyphobacterium marinum TaxID=3116574 RepID=A0ABU7LXZ0_9PROT|nr:ABC transporter ATP-binding protein [Hyphobacterium sp. Y6023]MEE2566394.1 ABC transporter ATP-binding protein [Hyphobacterium sp. Y6023]